MGPGALAQAHPRRDRRLAAPAPYRLRGSLPAPPPRSRDADRREPARARRRGSRRQGALRRLLELLRVSGGARARAQRAARPGAASTAVQPRYNLLFRQVERELLPLCVEERHRRDPVQPDRRRPALRQAPRARPGRPPGTRFTHPTAGARYQERYWHERELATVEALRPLAAEAGMSMVQMAVAWVLANPAITAPIIGASRPEQLDDALAAVDKRLDAGSQGAPRRAHARVPLGRRHPLMAARRGPHGPRRDPR